MNSLKSDQSKDFFNEQRVSLTELFLLDSPAGLGGGRLSAYAHMADRSTGCQELVVGLLSFSKAPEPTAPSLSTRLRCGTPAGSTLPAPLHLPEPPDGSFEESCDRK